MISTPESGVVGFVLHAAGAKAQALQSRQLVQRGRPVCESSQERAGSQVPGAPFMGKTRKVLQARPGLLDWKTRRSAFQSGHQEAVGRGPRVW